MKRRILAGGLAALMMGLLGCESDSGDGLPANPSLTSRAGTSSELWYFGYKTYDNTFRIRWPSHFANALGVGPGSYTLVNGERAEFRSYDTDNRSNRPSYTMPGPMSRLSGRVLCILVSASGERLAWFETEVGPPRQGALP